MTKADLKTGMIVTCRNGYKYLLMFGTDNHYKDIGIGHDTLSDWIEICDYTDDLIYNGGYFAINDGRWDIVKVEKTHTITDIRKWIINPDSVSLRVIWERPEEKKKYTYEQIKEILGEEFEIVKE